MVDMYGRWTPEDDYDNYPKEKMCQLDIVCNEIQKSGYKVKTDMEGLILKMLSSYEDYIEENETYYTDGAFTRNYNTEGFDLEDFKCFIEENGGYSEYDYEC